MQNFSKKIFGLAGAALMFAGMAFGQDTCSGPTAGANLIRNESTTDQVADLTFSCTAGGGGLVNILVFESLPVTSKVLTTTGTAWTEALAIVNATGTSVQGTVSGSQITFSGVTLPAGATTVTITNIRVNATSLSVGSGTPPAVTESVFISGAGANAAALAATPVAYVLPGLATSKDSAVANSVVCSNIIPGSNNSNFTVNFNENFPTAFKVAGTAVTNAVIGSEFTGNTETGYVPAAWPSGATLTNIANSATRVKVVFTNVPANLTVYVPTVAPATCTGAGCVPAGSMTLTASETGAFSAVAASTVTGTFAPPAGTAAVTISGGTGQAVYEVTADSPAVSNSYAIVVTMIGAANTITASATAVSTAVSFAPVGSTNIPNFVIGTSTTTFAGSTFSICSTSLLFPFVTNQLGFDTGIAISNTSTDNLASNGTKSAAVPQSGTCTLAFYGAGAPSPSTVTTPNVPTATTYTVVLSGIAAGFQGYIVASCGFQYAHAFAFITDGVGANGGLSQGYLALVLPSGTGARASGAIGESLAQ
jgi:hypothetical protein